MLRFWTQRAQAYGTDPRANTNDVHLRALEQDWLCRWIVRAGAQRVLDFGCANGGTTALLARMFPEIRFLGIDLCQAMIDRARAQDSGDNLSFEERDILARPLSERFDVIISVRVMQNVESESMQHRIADALIDALSPGGMVLFIESYAAEYAQLDEDRAALGLPALPRHAHQTLLTPAFDHYVARRTAVVERSSIASTYYLVTRLIYSALASERGEAIDYDHPLHRLAAQVPQIGEYGPLIALACRRTDKAHP